MSGCTSVEGECSTTEPKCNDVCQFNYDPVCCTYADGTSKTYGNDCTASVDNCQRGTSESLLTNSHNSPEILAEFTTSLIL